MSNGGGGYRGTQGAKPKASTIVERQRKKGRPASSRKGQLLPPSELSEVAKAEWKRVSKLLKEAGLIESIDKSLLAVYCIAYERWMDACDKLKTTSMIAKAPSGYPMINPYWTIQKQAADQMIRLASEFGLTPASRSRLPQAAQEKKKPIKNKPIDFMKCDPRDLLGKS